MRFIVVFCWNFEPKSVHDLFIYWLDLHISCSNKHGGWEVQVPEASLPRLIVQSFIKAESTQDNTTFYW